MKKNILIGLCLTILFAGCSNKKINQISSTSVKENDYKQIEGDAYKSYSSAVKNIQNADSCSAAVSSTYTMNYSDNTSGIFAFDGVLENASSDGKVQAHLTQNIESNGDTFNMEGYYYDGKLYNSYNGIQYYEDMEYSDVESTMLVPLHPYSFDKGDISKITAKEDTEGNVVYTIVLDNQKASDLFSSRYDTYGLNKYDDYSVKSNTIVDTFDADGHFISEKSNFDTSVSTSGQTVDVTYEGSVNYLKFNETEIHITKDMKKDFKQYVYYEDIDTSDVDSNDSYDDSEEKTVEATFKKRLVNRLGYSIKDDGTYQQDYNDNENYTIDFKNKTFTYTNYSIKYTYNWKGNIGAMGACTVNFTNDQKSSRCEDSTADMVKTVEQYFEMELYYCGLSLSDLQSESQK